MKDIKNKKYIIWSSPVFIGILVGLLIISWLPRTTDIPATSGSSKLSVVKKIFGVNEKPVLNLSVGASRAAWIGVGTAEAAEQVRTEVTYDGHTVDIPVDVNNVGSGKYQLELDPITDIKPGKYSVTAKWGSEPYEEATQTFAWGVLSINTTRPSYVPGETAQIHMGVLSSTGHTLCAAPITLKIIAPDGGTEMPVINNSAVCKGDTYVTEPDYHSSYKVGAPGQYRMVLRMADTDYEMDAEFEVRNSLPFVIERAAPTRLYPPATYTNVIKVTANRDFSGTVIEQLPAGFTVSNVVGAKVDGTKMSWPAEIKASGTYEFTYSFKAPNKSPAFYELSRLKFSSGQQMVYEESRGWQMAGDAVIGFVSQNSVTATSSAPSVTISPASTAGNLLVAVVGVQSVTDTAGNTWALATAATGGAETRSEIWYAKNASSVTSVTVNLPSSFVTLISVSQYSNVDTAAPLDVANGQGNASSVNMATPSINTTVAGDLVIANGSFDSGSQPAPTNPGAPWTILTSPTHIDKRLHMAYQVAGAAGPYSTSWTLATAKISSGNIAAFKAVSDSGSGGGTCGAPGIAFVKQTTVNITTPAGSDLNRSLTSTAGNALIMYYQIEASTVRLSSVTDSAGNTWVLAPTADNNNPASGQLGSTSGFAYALNIAATTTISVTMTGSTDQFSYTVAEFSGIATSSAVDQSGPNEVSSATTASTTDLITTTNANDLIIATSATETVATAFAQGSSTPSSGWTALDTNSGGAGGGFMAAAYIISSATGNYQGAFTTASSQTFVNNIMAFKAAPTGVAVTMDQVMRGGMAFCPTGKARYFWAS